MSSAEATREAPVAEGSTGEDADAKPVWWGRKWYALAILVLIYIFGSADRSVISVIAEPLKREFGLSDTQIGALGGMAYSVTYAIAVLPAGWLVDRINRKALLSTSVTIWSFLTAICAAASSFPMLIFARMGVGVAEASASPASLSLIADTFPLRQRNTAVSIYYAGTAAGQLVIFLVGGWLLVHFGWRTVFLVAGLPGLALAALLYFTTSEPERGAFDPDRRERKQAIKDNKGPKLADTVRDIIGNRSLQFAIPAITISAGSYYSLTIWTTSFLVRIHDFSVALAAIWTGIGLGLAMTLGSLVIGPIADRFSQGDPRRLSLIPALACASAVFGGAVMALGPTPTISLIGVTILSFMGGIITATGYALILSLARANVRGSTLAATKLVSILLGSGLIPLFTGAISDGIGGPESMRPAILGTVALLGVAAYCYWMAGRRAPA